MPALLKKKFGNFNPQKVGLKITFCLQEENKLDKTDSIYKLIYSIYKLERILRSNFVSLFDNEFTAMITSFLT